MNKTVTLKIQPSDWADFFRLPGQGFENAGPGLCADSVKSVFNLGKRRRVVKLEIRSSRAEGFLRVVPHLKLSSRVRIARQTFFIVPKFIERMGLQGWMLGNKPLYVKIS